MTTLVSVYLFVSAPSSLTETWFPAILGANAQRVFWLKSFDVTSHPATPLCASAFQPLCPAFLTHVLPADDT